MRCFASRRTELQDCAVAPIGTARGERYQDRPSAYQRILQQSGRGQARICPATSPRARARETAVRVARDCLCHTANTLLPPQMLGGVWGALRSLPPNCLIWRVRSLPSAC